MKGSRLLNQLVSQSATYKRKHNKRTRLYSNCGALLCILFSMASQVQALDPGENYCLYTDPFFQGEKLCGTEEVPILLTRRFHGTVSSIEVRDGLEMIAFRYRWNQRDPVVLTGQNPELGGWDNRILSFALTANIPLDQRVCFYSRANYTGSSFCISEDHPALTWGRYNGYRSIRIPQGMDITTYYSGSYQGAANTYASDVPVVARGATRVDSVRIR